MKVAYTTLQCILTVESELQDHLKSSAWYTKHYIPTLIDITWLVRKAINKPAAQWTSVAGEEVNIQISFSYCPSDPIFNSI